MVVTLNQADLQEARRLNEIVEAMHYTEVWKVYGLSEKGRWREDENIVQNSPIIRFTPAHPEQLDKICSDAFFAPEQGVLFDLGDTYSSKALIEYLGSLGYGLDQVNAIFMTHLHTDHFGKPELFTHLGQRIPVYSSPEEISSYQSQPLNALEVCFRWQGVRHSDDTNVARQGLLVRNSNKYNGQLVGLKDVDTITGLKVREMRIDDLSDGPLPEGELGYITFPNHHSSCDTVYVLGKYLFIGDVLAEKSGPLGNTDNEEYAVNAREIGSRLINRQLLGLGFKIIPGHDKKYYSDKIITLSGELSEYAPS
ncbi:MAG: MBL fold metallo-hydrolase [Nanoarchaeota archaeon]|nr:MBL fold metallo-hydrolase [Nanoarchaeota archaeon]